MMRRNKVRRICQPIYTIRCFRVQSSGLSQLFQVVLALLLWCPAALACLASCGCAASAVLVIASSISGLCGGQALSDRDTLARMLAGYACFRLTQHRPNCCALRTRADQVTTQAVDLPIAMSRGVPSRAVPATRRMPCRDSMGREG
ncbi:hypothetical protein KVR01_000254 [Diaporthe batatas]|uniref:uncharacterized protein n=1 Tax=Diaporthe batatas TaxID=748121 RepID=UPI001D0536EC|nr:uncharacterized protein KVR01_000254 [Diaporthe batatas]KAG8169509.1 hypothetical protein KVR01_000254 [Diaporthe batatas]